MKIKLDFVTNSSSVCYLISVSTRLTKKRLDKLNIRQKCINDFFCTKDIDKLIQYVDQEPVDWIKRVTGPVKFWNASRGWYKIAREVLENGDYIVFIDLERNYYDECVDRFDNLMYHKIEGEILERESE
jgi:hypothetical protein